MSKPLLKKTAVKKPATKAAVKTSQPEVPPPQTSSRTGLTRSPSSTKTKPPAPSSKPATKPSAAKLSSKAPSGKKANGSAAKPDKDLSKSKTGITAFNAARAKMEALMEAERVNLTVANGTKTLVLPDGVNGAPAGYTIGRGGCLYKTPVPVTDAMMETVCRMVADGGSLQKVCRGPGLPDRWTFFKALAENPGYAKLYNTALALRGEHYADEMTELSDEAMGALTSEEAQAYKLRVQTRQWVVSRLLPKKYGDKMVIAGDVENPLVMSMVSNSADLVKKLKGVKSEDD